MFERHDFYGFLEESFFLIFLYELSMILFYIFLMMFNKYVMMFDDCG